MYGLNLQVVPGASHVPPSMVAAGQLTMQELARANAKRRRLQERQQQPPAIPSTGGATARGGKGVPKKCKRCHASLKKPSKHPKTGPCPFSVEFDKGHVVTQAELDGADTAAGRCQQGQQQIDQ